MQQYDPFTTLLRHLLNYFNHVVCFMTATYIMGPFVKILKISAQSLFCIGEIKGSKSILHIQKPKHTTLALIKKRSPTLTYRQKKTSKNMGQLDSMIKQVPIYLNKH